MLLGIASPYKLKVRADKFLQVSRLIKQRRYAKEACDRGYVFINGKRAKPSEEVRPGDRITLDLPSGRVEVEVLEVPEGKSISKEKSAKLYRVIGMPSAPSSLYNISMTRDQALALIKSSVPNKNLVKHMIACAACMRAMALRHGYDPDRWELAGLLHDLDVAETSEDFAKHGIVAVQRLRAMGFGDEEVLDAILAHAEKKPLETPMERALYAVDPTTGFIVACALMHPTKTLAGLDLEFLKKRFKERRFAAGASREQMASCESLGMSLDEFLTLCLEAMRGVAPELGL